MVSEESAMGCSDIEYSTYTKVGDMGTPIVNKAPSDAPDPQSDYTTELKNQVDAYVSENSEARPNCPESCKEIDIVQVRETEFEIAPSWTWSESYVDKTQSPPAEARAKYRASAVQQMRKVTKLVICAPRAPAKESALLSDGARVDWDNASLITAIENSAESDRSYGSIELLPLLRQKGSKES